MLAMQNFIEKERSKGKYAVGQLCPLADCCCEWIIEKKRAKNVHDKHVSYAVSKQQSKGKD